MISPILLILAALTPFPRPSTLERRLEAFPGSDWPLHGDVTIRWNEHQIPFIEASDDRDVSVALGAVNAHLRLGQIELLRHISQGRIAELIGPVAVPVDRAIRTLDLAKAVPTIEADLPDDTREWLSGFADGINHYRERAPAPPHEHRALAISSDPWTVADILTIGRLISIDVNWLDWFPLLKLRDRADWPELWRRLAASGESSLPSFREGARMGILRRVLSYFSRSGSNSLVVSGRRSATGAALIASDPHVGLMVPNMWLAAGYRSPKHAAIGLMFPGLPFIALGRNDHIAWGGTNMHAASSDLFDVSGLDSGAFTTRQERIKSRWWFDRPCTVRESPYGPVLSDARVLGTKNSPPFALRWVGHDPSDEFTSLLRMSRARNWREFRGALDNYAVSGMNILYADVDGNIGQVLAVKLPRRDYGIPKDIILDPAEAGPAWSSFVRPEDLPHSYNPAEGFLVSANNRPVEASVRLAYFFSTNDRIQRISELLAAQSKVGVADLKEIQRDVYMFSAAQLRDTLVSHMTRLEVDPSLRPAAQELVTLIKSWDGHYRAGSRGALAFELFVHHLSKQFYGQTFVAGKTATFATIGRIKGLLEEDLAALKPAEIRSVLVNAVKSAAPLLKRFQTWGDMHRYGLSHPIGALPLIGRRYRFLDYPAPGSSDTILKTAHGSTARRHRVGYGASARHISDLSDPDNNWFALLGGQDGWIKSDTFLDQVPLWLERSYVRVPFRRETVAREFRHSTVMKAAPKAAAAKDKDARRLAS